MTLLISTQYSAMFVQQKTYPTISYMALGFSFLPIPNLMACVQESMLVFKYADWNRVSPSTIGTYELMSKQLIMGCVFIGVYWVLFLLIIKGTCTKKNTITGKMPTETENEEE